MTPVDIFTIIGSVFGCIGFAISLYLGILENPKIKTVILGKQVFTMSPFFHKHIDNEGGYIEDYSKEHYLLGIHLLFTNCSKNPTSIFEITLNDSYFLNTSTKNTLKSFPIDFYFDNGHISPKSYYSYNVDSLKPVIRLDNNETIDCCITFDNVPSDLLNEKYLKLTIKSSQKVYTTKFKPNFIISPYIESNLSPNRQISKY